MGIFGLVYEWSDVAERVLEDVVADVESMLAAAGEFFCFCWQV